MKRGPGACDSPRLDARHFGELVVSKIRSNILTAGNIRDLVKVVDEQMDGVAGEQRKRLKTIESELSDVRGRLDFEADGIRLSVSDDGIGLPDDYAERGRGLSGMRADAERLGGRLIVETGGPGGGTTVTCEMPL